MEIRQIRYALTVAKERSFTRASARLNISQSAISEQVKLLEQNIGFEIFRRTGRGVELTESGRRFLYQAERVVDDVLGLADAARSLRGVGINTVSLGIVSGLAPSLLPRLLPSKNVPANVHLEIKTAPTRTLFEDLHEDRLDVAIAVEVPHDRIPAGLSVSRVTEISMVLVTASDHPLTKLTRPVDIGLLASEPIIMSELSIGYGQIVGSMFDDIGIRPRTSAVVDNIETMKVAVQSGIGIALVPEGSADNEARLGLLSIIPLAHTRKLTISAYQNRRATARRKEAILKRVVVLSDTTSP